MYASFSRLATLFVLSAFLLPTIGCDSLDSDPVANLSLDRAEVVGAANEISVYFQGRVDPSSITTEAFRVSSNLDNGRGVRNNVRSVRYRRRSNSVVLTTGLALGNGTHTVRASGVRDADGIEANELSISFLYRQ